MFVPTPMQRPAQTHHSRELGRRMEQVIRDYQREHPELTDDEVRAALLQSSVTTDEGEATLRTRRMVAIGVAVAAALAGAVVSIARPGSGRSGVLTGGSAAWQVVVVAIAVVAILIAFLRRSRR